MEKATRLKKRSVTWIILLGALTLGIYNSVWFLLNLKSLNALAVPRKLDARVFHATLVMAVLSIAQVFLSAFSGFERPLVLEVVGSVCGYASIIVLIVQSFKVKKMLKEHVDQYPDAAVKFSNGATLLLWYWYLQYMINRIVGLGLDGAGLNTATRGEA